MSTKETKKGDCKKSAIESADKYPGAAINIADNGKVSPKLVKERTKALDMNPHSEGL